MTKLRRWLSKLSLWAAAFVCGLLLNGVPAAWAGQSGAKGKATPVKKTTNNKKSNKSARHAHAPAEQLGVAELLDNETAGLRGQASFYGRGFSGRKTSTGEIFDIRKFTAASNRFSLGTRVAVQRLDNEKCAIVTVNDRMHAKHRRRVIDVSRGVAEYLDMVRAGVVIVRVIALPKQGEAAELGRCRAAFDETEEADGQPEKMPNF